jgi:hypothetical protein
LLKAYAIQAAPRAAAIALFANEISSHEQELAEYQAIRARIEARNGGRAPGWDDEDFGNYATLRYGISYARHHLRWCRWMLNQLRPI